MRGRVKCKRKLARKDLRMVRERKKYWKRTANIIAVDGVDCSSILWTLPGWYSEYIY